MRWSSECCEGQINDTVVDVRCLGRVGMQSGSHGKLFSEEERGGERISMKYGKAALMDVPAVEFIKDFQFMCGSW